MNIAILGAAGFIGTNLLIELVKDGSNIIRLVDVNKLYFANISEMGKENVSIMETTFDALSDYDAMVSNCDLVYHLVSTNVPTTSNKSIADEISINIAITTRILDACVRNNVKRIVFLSSGGTIYGKEIECPLNEKMPTNPINAYGIQKLAIEKILYLYNYLYSLDYKIVRLSNPYGPYQRPNGILGAVTTFTYKAINNERIEVYGDGSVIRDFIYIKDAIRGIIKISKSVSSVRIYNLGSGKGESINEVLSVIQDICGKKLEVIYKSSRNVDVPINYLDISLYENEFGKFESVSLYEGINELVNFIEKERK